MTQADRYDKNGEYVKLWLPELSGVDSDYIHTPWMLDKSILKDHKLENTPFSQPICVPERWRL
jgi:deoxyribodipyrimidine photo-lyase